MRRDHYSISAARRLSGKCRSPDSHIVMHSIHQALAAFCILCTTPIACAHVLEVRGELVAATCVIQPVGPMVIGLGAVPLTAADQALPAMRTPFSVSIQCAGASGTQRLGVRFDGPRAVDMKSIALTAASTASGIGVALFDENDTEIPLGQDSTRSVNVTSRQPWILRGSAAFRTTGVEASAGTAYAEFVLTLIYR